MKERIYSIPLTDALLEGCGCILCTLEKKLENDALDYFLGPSMMEPDGRELTNEKGFCRRHLPLLFEKGNRLGLALVLETYTKEFASKIKLEKKGGFMQKGYNSTSIGKQLTDATKSCALCDKVSSQLRDAAGNLAYLWDKEESFRNSFEKQGNLCPEHAGLVLSVCDDEISAKNRNTFIETIVSGQKSQLDSLYEDLHEFVLSFDYRNAGKPLSDKASQSVQKAVNHFTKF